MTHSFLSLQTLPISLRKWRKPALTVLTLPLLISPALPAYAQDITSNLIGHWKLDETSGTTVFDSSPSGNDGTFTGEAAVVSQSGFVGNALYFDDVDDYVAFGDLYDFNYNDTRTISAWIKADSLYPNNELDSIVTKQVYGGGYTGWGFGLTFNGRLRFEYITTLSSNHYGRRTSSSVVEVGKWTHVAVVYSSATATFYVNGQVVPSSTLTNTISSSIDSAHPFNIGARNNDSASGRTEFHGLIDDVRIYSRALTAADITELYETSHDCTQPAGQAGSIVFNDDVDVMEYCNGNEWVGMGAPPTPDAWGQIGNSRTIASSASQSGIATLDTNLIAFVNRTSATLRTYSWDGTNWNQVGNGLGASVHMVAKIDTNTIAAMNANTTGSNPLRTYTWDGTDWTMVGNQLNINSSAAAITELGTNQIAFIDRLNEQLRTYAWDGTDWSQVGNNFALSTNTPALATLDNNTIAYNSNGGSLTTLSWDGTNWSQVGNSLATGGSGTSDMTAIDSSTIVMATNQDIRVYSFDGTDWSLSYQTEDITGSSDTTIDLIAPNTIAMKGWNGNSYLLRTFGVPSSCSVPTSGLVGHWAMDELTGTGVADSSGNGNNGTWSGEVDVVSTTGKVSTAFSLDGVNDMITVPHSASLDISSGYTVSGWVYFDSTQAGTITPALISKNDGGGWGSGWVMGRASGGGNIVGGKVRMVTQHNRNISSPSSKASGWIYPVDTWNYVTVSWDGNTIKYYLDGILIESGIISVPPDTSSGDLWIGHGRSNWYSAYHQGHIDEMRLYNYALSDTEIASLYGASGGTCNVETCSSPFGFKGGLIFNTSHNVMQYCNGKNWTAMGPAGNGGGGCSNPTGVQAELMYNSDLNVLQYCEGDEWIGITPKLNDTLSSGLIGHWKLDETSGSVIADSSGNGNNGTWVDGDDTDVTGETSTGQVNNALTFDGSDDLIFVNGFLGSPKDITLTAWFNADSLANGHEIISLGDNVSLRTSGTYIRGFYYNGSNWNNLTAPNSLSTGTWYHATYVIDSTNNSQKLYLNGTEVQSSSHTADIVYGLNSDTYIGMHGSGAPAGLALSFNGQLDDVRIYSRALSAAEITEVYNLGTPPVDITSNLIAHWTLDETSGTIAYDSIGSNDGTMTSMDGASNTVAGPMSTALSFSSSSLITAAAASTDLDDIFDGGGTISYWIYPTNWGTFGRVIDKSDSGTFPPDQGWHSQGSTGIIKFSQAFSTTHGDWETGANTVPMNTWSHIVITYDNSNDANTPIIYVNGVNSALTTVSAPSGTAVSDASQPITLGARQGGANNYTGYTDDIRMYSRVLTASEVTSLYNLGTP